MRMRRVFMTLLSVALVWTGANHGVSGATTVTSSVYESVYSDKDFTSPTVTSSVYGNLASKNLGLLNLTQDLSLFASPSTGYVDACSGKKFGLGLRGDGTVWSWGSNTNGEVGIPGQSNLLFPKRVQSLDNITAVACGFDHAVALDASGVVWVWGSNAYGQFGLGNKTGSNIPVVSGFPKDIVKISTDGNYILVLRPDGSVMGAGQNNTSQLGDGTTVDKLVPVSVSTSVPIKDLEATPEYVIAIVSDGSLIGWGTSGYNVLGRANGVFSIPIEILGIVNVKKVSGAGTGVYAITENGDLYSWGVNYYNLLISGGNRTTPLLVGTGYKDVLAHADFSFLLTEGGDVLSWGVNWQGKLGNGGTDNVDFPSPIGHTGVKKLAKTVGETNILIFEDGTMKAWGPTTPNGTGLPSASKVPLPVQGSMSNPTLTRYSAFPAVSISSLPATVSGSMLMKISDYRGTSAGWSVSLSSTDFMATVLDKTTAGQAMVIALPSSSFSFSFDRYTLNNGYPLTVGADLITPSTPVTLSTTPTVIASARTGSGTGDYDLYFNTSAVIPTMSEVLSVTPTSKYSVGDKVGIFATTYSNTISITIASGL